MLELAPDGFEEIEGLHAVELAVYTDGAGQGRIRAAFTEVSVTPVDERWAERWRDFHRPVSVGGLWIGPPWEQAPSGEDVVVVDPGRAFGTGAHPTTRVSIELLSGLERGALLDAGCGSGVLAVAALRLGFGPVVAVDVDAVAVEVTRETASRNGVTLDVREVDVVRGALPAADVVVANIDLAAVEALLARHPASTLVSSGYLAGQVPRANGWELVRGLELDGWAAHVHTANEGRTTSAL